MSGPASAFKAREKVNGRTTTLSDDLRSRLEDMIVSGALQPGERVDEADIASRFQMSRTPVREAMKALIALGLLEMKGRQGVTVASVSIPVLLEMFEMMAALEGLCAKLAARRATKAQNAALREIHGRLIAAATPDLFYAINGEFHDLLYEASHTHFIAGQTRALRKRLAAYRRHVTFQPGRMTATIAEHERILQAVEARDAEASFKAASDHVNLLGDDIADFIAALPRAITRAS